jgi:hypothetical protein
MALSFPFSLPYSFYVPWDTRICSFSSVQKCFSL